MRPGAAVLVVQHPIGVGDGGDVEHAVGAARFFQLRPQAQEALALDAAVDHDVADMNVLRPEFARHALRQRPQRRLGGYERGKIGLAAQRTAGTGENQAAAAAREQRRDRGLRQLEAAERVLAPVRLELLLAQLQERRRPVRTGIVDGHRQWSEFFGRFDKTGDIGRFRGVADDVGYLGAGRSEFCGSGRELVAVPACNRNRIAARRKTAGDGRAEPLRGADTGNQDAALRRSRLKNGRAIHESPFG